MNTYIRMILFIFLCALNTGCIQVYQLGAAACDNEGDCGPNYSCIDGACRAAEMSTDGDEGDEEISSQLPCAIIGGTCLSTTENCPSVVSSISCGDSTLQCCVPLDAPSDGSEDVSDGDDTDWELDELSCNDIPGARCEDDFGDCRPSEHSSLDYDCNDVTTWCCIPQSYIVDNSDCNFEGGICVDFDEECPGETQRESWSCGTGIAKKCCF